MRASKRLLGVLLSAFLCAACGGSEENRGKRLLGDDAMVTDLVWSTDSREIFYVGEGFVSRLAADGSSKEIVHDSASEYALLRPAPDGSALYALTRAEVGAAFEVMELFSDQVLPIEPFSLVLDVMHDSQRLAYVSAYGIEEFSTAEQTTRLLSTEALPRFSGAGQRGLLVASPFSDELFMITDPGARRDEDGLLVGGGAGPGVFGGVLLDLSSDSAQAVELLEANFPSAAFTPAGIRVVGGGGSDDYVIGDPVAGTSARLFAAPDSLASVFAPWSPDGRRIAAWNEECLEGGDSFLSCGERRIELHVVEVAAGKSRPVASAEDTWVTGGLVAFSPDGTRVAYSFGAPGIRGGLHVTGVD